MGSSTAQHGTNQQFPGATRHNTGPPETFEDFPGGMPGHPMPLIVMVDDPDWTSLQREVFAHLLNPPDTEPATVGQTIFLIDQGDPSTNGPWVVVDDGRQNTGGWRCERPTAWRA